MLCVGLGWVGGCVGRIGWVLGGWVVGYFLLFIVFCVFFVFFEFFLAKLKTLIWDHHSN